jgi:hypothetical protein
MMNVLKFLGWISVPYVMVFFAFKKQSNKKRLVSILWAIVSLSAVISLSNTSSNTTISQDPINNEKETITSEKESNDPGISKAEFDQIKSGMTYQQVVEIIGSEGEVLSESGTPGGTSLDIHTVMYMWEGESGLGANANMMFQGNKLQNKAQFGLQ